MLVIKIKLFVDAFVNYGKILLANFADRVPRWVTSIEPLLYAFNFEGVGNVIHAHAQVYRFYHEELRAPGKMSLKLNDNFGVPKNPKNNTHVEAANRFNKMQLTFFTRQLNKTEMKFIGQTADFFAIDPCAATVDSPADEGITACAANKSSSDSFFPYCNHQETKNVYG